jgi:amino acid transporter
MPRKKDASGGDIELADINPAFSKRRSIVESDDEKLRKMGYEPQLHRGFSSVMAFCFCFTSVAVVSSISGLFSTGMAQGGPVVIIWSWIIGSLLTLIVSCTMAELCSTYPSAGSVYHWAGNLASESWGPLMAYITGWFNFLGNAAGVAFYGYTFAASIAAVVKKNGYYGDPDDDDTQDMSVTGQTLIAMSVFVLWTFQNFLRIDYQGYINNFATFWQLASTIGIVITLFVMCPQSGTASWNASNTDATDNSANVTDDTNASMATAAQVFGEWYNGTGFDDAPGYVIWVGALFVSFCLTGYEAAGHMSEETAGADTSGPSSMIYTVALSALTGFLYLLGLLFATAHRVKDFVDNEEDVTDVFSQCSGPVGGNILACALIVNVYFSGYSSFTVTARTAFASKICFLMAVPMFIMYLTVIYFISSLFLPL